MAHPRMISKPSVRCRACKYVWTPIPKKWSNTNSIVYKGKNIKVLYCPNCTTRNYLSLEDVRELIRWWKRRG